jgi:aryl-alcohol dehydrogenase-like predicted oxidoreductase
MHAECMCLCVCVQDPTVVHAALDALGKLKTRGEARYVAMSTHDFDTVVPLVQSGKLDAAMLRYNMAHKTAESEAFPACLTAAVPVLAFTTTRWNTLQSGHRKWDDRPPSTADCISYALTHPAVSHVINGVRTTAELDEIMGGMWAAPLDQTNASFPTWDEYGRLVYGDQANLMETADAFDAVGTNEEPVCERHTPALVCA